MALVELGISPWSIKFWSSLRGFMKIVSSRFDQVNFNMGKSRTSIAGLEDSSWFRPHCFWSHSSYEEVLFCNSWRKFLLSLLWKELERFGYPYLLSFSSSGPIQCRFLQCLQFLGRLLQQSVVSRPSNSLELHRGLGLQCEYHTVAVSRPGVRMKVSS